MIQFILILMGLVFPSSNAGASLANNSSIITEQGSVTFVDESTEDTSGDNGQLPPKK